MLPSDRLSAGVRVQDVGKIASALSDMRKILRQDPRIIQKLHRRVFLDGVDRDQVCTCRANPCTPCRSLKLLVRHVLPATLDVQTNLDLLSPQQ